MNRKFSWLVAAALCLCSPAVLALGLGGASIDSYLGQALDVRVEVISESSEELNSITAGLASADDFEYLGLNRSAITVPLKFELVTDESQSYIHITSDLRVSEPVVQVLLEVVWANGRMLREYTLFLDPPTINSKAPPVVVKPTPKPAPVQNVRRPSAGMNERDIPEPESSESIKPSGTQDIQQPAENDVAGQADEQRSDAEVYGPVASGETLWGIASQWSKHSGYTVNQAMLALQRENPDAFMHGNINSLKRGAILRLPAISEMAEISSREAMLEVLRQQEDLNVVQRAPRAEFSTPTVADSGGYQESVIEPEPQATIEDDPGHLELVPPQDENQQEKPTQTQAAPADAGQAVREKLSRTEEELFNARQENSYLNQRIQKLEAAVKAVQETSGREKAIDVEDSDLAKIESIQAKESANDLETAPIAITPEGESQPWYSGKTGLIAGVAIVLVGFIIWVLRRRSASFVELETSDPAREMVSEKDEIEPAGDTDTHSELRSGAEYREALNPKPTPAIEPESPPQSTSEPEAADIADDGDEDDRGVETDDPETKLDLARAYLSLGDKEASRSMLEEVINTGSEAQKAEAQQMMDEIR